MYPFVRRHRLAFWLLSGTLVFAMIFSAPSQAASTPQQVFDAPGGNAIGLIRDGDRVQMLEYQTVYRGGVNERWALVEFGDAYDRGKGWMRLDNVSYQQPETSDYAPLPSNRPSPGRLPAPPQRPPSSTPPQDYFRSAPPSESLAQTSIRDMDINCYRGSRGSIQGCNLSVEVDIKSYAQSASAGNAILLCQADLRWFAVGGGEQITSSQAYDNVSLYGGSLRRRLELNFNFGGAGATGAMVENQRCQTQASTGDGYYEPRGYR